MWLTLLLLVHAGLGVGMALFLWESVREQEPMAPRRGRQLLAGLAGLTLLAVAVPALGVLLLAAYALAFAALGVSVAWGVPAARARRGTRGSVAGEVERVDERDVVFARNRSLRPGSEEYRVYYEELHPELRVGDDRRRAQGGPLGVPGRIDGWRPNSAMMFANFQLPTFLGTHAVAAPATHQPPVELEPAHASRIVKGLARHLGAAAVGICRVDPRWVYSRRGEIHRENWGDWGKPIDGVPPYAVVVATEMDHELVGGAPHTPAVVESAANYARGAYITTILAQWFSALGYRGEAEHNRHYQCLMVPLAVDAGLGELGRFGYLISDRVGARCRLFACLTDLPLEPDEPVDLGAEAFCAGCRKCADSCPSRSIPQGRKTVRRGTRRWVIDADTCFGYWGRVGTDCCICMGVCPFSRPNRSVHKVARHLLKRSALFRRLAPGVDNFLYGARWKPRRVPAWVQYPRKDGEAEVPAAERGKG